MGSFGKNGFCNDQPIPDKLNLAKFSKNNCPKIKQLPSRAFPPASQPSDPGTNNFNSGLTGVKAIACHRFTIDLSLS
jgi:hypothetical protein